MQFKVLVISALISFAAASPGATDAGSASPATTTIAASKCKTGALQCCQTVQKASENPTAQLLGTLGIPIQDVNIPVGLTCDPISVIGVGGQSCSANPVCCKENNFNGLVALGCTAVNLGL